MDNFLVACRKIGVREVSKISLFYLENIVFNVCVSGSDLFSQRHHGDQEDQHGQGGHHRVRAPQVLCAQEQSSDEHLKSETILLQRTSPPEDAQQYKP